MAPVTHLLFSWLSTVRLFNNRRERAIVTLAGVAPDLDGLGIIVDKFNGSSNYYFSFHHHLGHSLFAALIIATLAMLLSKVQKAKVFIASFLLVQAHILFDVIGSKSPDGFQWPIHYLSPVNDEFLLVWSGQWYLNSWQNILFTFCLVCLATYYAVTKKLTVFEIINDDLNNAAIRLIEKYK